MSWSWSYKKIKFQFLIHCFSQHNQLVLPSKCHPLIQPLQLGLFFFDPERSETKCSYIAPHFSEYGKVMSLRLQLPIFPSQHGYYVNVFLLSPFKKKRKEKTNQMHIITFLKKMAYNWRRIVIQQYVKILCIKIWGKWIQILLDFCAEYNHLFHVAPYFHEP